MATEKRPPLITSEYLGDLAILRIETEALTDSLYLEQFDVELKAAIDRHTRVILDLARIRFLSSAAQSKLIRTHRDCRKKGGQLILCCPVQTVREVFRINRLDCVFHIVSSLEEAVAALRWSLAIGCPIEGCQGDALSHEPSITARGGDLCCRSCGCRFRALPFDFPQNGEARAEVQSFEIPTYEHELIRVELGDPVLLAVVGRLDLFAAEAVADAWRSLQRPRCGLIDLHDVSEMSDRGLRMMGEQVHAGGSADRIAVLVNPERFDRTRSALPGIPVATTKGDLMPVLRDPPQLAETTPRLLVRARPVASMPEQAS